MQTQTQEHSTKMPARSAPTPTGLVLMSITALVASTAYLAWRVLATMDANLWLAVPLLAAETVVIVRFALSLAGTGPEPGPGARAESSGDLHTATNDREHAPGGKPGESVEVFVVAAGADSDALNRTLALASIDSPSSVRVLDTFFRAEIETEALRHGANYEVLGAPRDGRVRSNQNQSAGLIDLALRTCETPFALWLDAGDVPVPGLLGLVAAFDDPDVAVVQSAADLVNRDSLLHLAPGHDERALENRVAGPSLDRAGAAPWEGSGSLMRVAAFEQIGGLPRGRGSITHRGVLRLVRAGMKVRFCAEPLVRTVAPDTLTEYLDTEERISHSDWTLLGTADTPLRFRAGLRASLTQLHRSTTALDGLARFTFLGVLTAVLLTGQLPFSAAPIALAGAFAVQFFVRSATVRALGRGSVRIGDPTRQSLRLMGARLAALLRPAPERSTAESQRWAVLGRLPLLTAALIVVDVALGLRILTLFWPGLLPPLDGAGRFVAMAAAAWAVLAILDVLHVLVARVQRRVQHRQGSDLVVELDGQACRSVDLTPLGVGLLLPEALVNGSSSRPGLFRGDSVAIRLDIPRLDGSITTLEAQARVEHVAVDPEGGLYRAGAAFTSIPPHGRDALVEFCALTAEHRERSRRPVEQTAPDDYEVAAPGRGRRALAMLSTIGLVVAGPFVVLGPSAGAADKDPRTAVISGQVLDQAENPVAGSCVGVWNDGGVPWVYSDAEGRFELTSVGAGSQIVVAQDCSGSGHMTTFAGSTPWADRADALDVGVGERVEGVEIVTLPSADITGRVLDDTGTPASQVCVNYGPSDGKPGTSQMWLGSTGEDGRYSGRVPAMVGIRVQMNDCSASPRFVTTWYPGVADSATAKTVSAGTDEVVDLGDSVMQPGSFVFGTVTDEMGAPVANACVSAQVVTEDSWNWAGGANTDKSGNYRFLVPAGTYSLWFSDCDGVEDLMPSWYPDAKSSTRPPPTVDVAGGENRFDATLRRGAEVVGTVTDESGKPRADVCVSAVSVTDHSWDWVGGSNTDKFGNYRFSVPEGSYSITADSCNDANDLVQTWYGGSPVSTTPAPTVSLNVGTNTPLDFQLTTGGRLTGSVTDTAGKPATGVCVSLNSLSSMEQDDWQSTGWARVNEDGSWRSSAVAPGDYIVHYSNCDSDGRWTESGTWIPEFYDDVPEPNYRGVSGLKTVAVEVGFNEPLQTDLMRAARVKGVITDTNGPAEGVCVNGALNQQVRTGPDGRYSLGLLPGEQTLTFSDCESGRGLVQEIRKLHLAPGEGVVADIAMTSAQPGSITGTVRTASDGVLQPACVVAYVPDELIGVAMVAPDGTFEVAGLGAGSYFVGVFGCSDDPDVPMVDPDTGAEYPASWFPGVPITFVDHGPPDPPADGATLMTVAAGGSTDASFCFGACKLKTPETTTTTTSTTPRTDPVPTTGVPTTGVPTTGVPTTGVPTTGVPTTAAPDPGSPATGAPTTTVPISGFAQVSSSGVSQMIGGENPVAPGVVSTDDVNQSGPAISGAVVAATSVIAPEYVDGATPYSAEPVLTRQVSEQLGDEVAASTRVTDQASSTTPWAWVGGALLLFGVLAGLFVLRRRSLTSS